MTHALRYALLGALCATIAGLFYLPWWGILIAFWLGTLLGLFIGLVSDVWGFWLERWFG